MRYQCEDISTWLTIKVQPAKDKCIELLCFSLPFAYCNEKAVNIFKANVEPEGSAKELGKATSLHLLLLMFTKTMQFGAVPTPINNNFGPLNLQPNCPTHTMEDLD